MYERFSWTSASAVRNEITRTYEPLQPYILVELCRRCEPDVFFDIGANIGAYAIAMSSVESLKTIFAFEPAPETMIELKQNIWLNGLEGRIRPMNIALSNREGRADFAVIHTLSGANGIADTHIHEPCKRERLISIPVQPLDQVFRDTAKRVAMKVDVEGHEIMVLEGARQIIERSDCLVQVELYRDVGASRQIMQEMGLHYLCHIGPDHYFSKGDCRFTDRALIEVFETAASEMLTDMQRRALKQGGQTAGIKRNIAPGVAIELSGRLASALRSARRGIGSDR